MIKQLFVVAYSNAVIDMFPTAMPVSGEQWVYRIDPKIDIEDALNKWGRRHKIKLKGFLGQFDRITAVWVHKNVVLATIKDYVYILSTAGLDSLYDALDVAAYVNRKTKNYVRILRNSKQGLLSALQIEGTAPNLVEIAEAARSLTITDDPVTIVFR